MSHQSGKDKVNYRTKTTKDGRIVLNGSTPKPVPAPTATTFKPNSVLGDPSLRIPIPAEIQVYKFPKDAMHMTGDELDIQQDFEDYLSILEDMDGSNYRTGVPPRDVIDLFDERVKQFAQSEFGQRTLKADRLGFLMNLDSEVDPENNLSDGLNIAIIEKYLHPENL